MNAPVAGPPGDLLDEFMNNQFEFIRSLESYGSAVSIDLAGTEAVWLFDLPSIQQVLVDKLEHVDMSPLLRRLQVITGSGLLTNYTWEQWQPRRRLIHKPIGFRALGAFLERMRSIIEERIASWPVDEEFELKSKLHDVTLRVVADLLFSESITEEAIDAINRLVVELHAWSEADPANENVSDPPVSFSDALDAVDAYVREVIESRDMEDPGDDMLGVLISAISDDGRPIDAAGVRDEAVTLVLAGHETVTATIAFAIDLVGRNPSTRSADRRHIVDETLRLYPPVHFLSRLIKKDFDVGVCTLPAGCEVFFPMIQLARDERYFERPDEFLPERWSPESQLHMDRRAYFPFIGGPKLCVGSHFALAEATAFMELFLDRYDFDLLDPVAPWGREFALTFLPDRPQPIRLSAQS
jgi:cytochrome P450